MLSSGGHNASQLTLPVPRVLVILELRRVTFESKWRNWYSQNHARFASFPEPWVLTKFILNTHASTGLTQVTLPVPKSGVDKGKLGAAAGKSLTTHTYYSTYSRTNLFDVFTHECSCPVVPVPGATTHTTVRQGVKQQATMSRIWQMKLRDSSSWTIGIPG
ncbi:hypothetical protein CROQUDRAFT_95972 [Cronartium quercuum f. sp. fusiforme G11]|uniref:Uncharacterized protein n=1 Tax=Cronartium quercuum f. sp. fusiforme G11 TaxID=708437 RepID=A0A9P6NHD2_9BASI|nr:hypothetical protein CROQUDRAFT_95972 [Cronartium quercuum f. sp. fusiforme G11]